MTQGLQLYYKRLALLQEYALYLWAFCIFFPQLNVAGYIFISSSFIKIITLQEYKDVKFSKHQIPYILLLIFLGWNFVTLLYSENLYEGLKQAEKKLPLILITLVGLFGKNNFILKKSLRFYSYGAVFAVFIALCYALFLSFQTTMNFTESLNSSFLKIFEHKLYITILVVMIIPLSIHKLFKKQRSGYDILLFIALLGVLFLTYALGFKMVFVIALCLLFFVAFMNYKEKWRTPITAIALVVTMALLCSMVFVKSGGAAQSKPHIANGSINMNSRYLIWTRALEVIQENFLFGVGIGDGENAMLKAYLDHKNIVEYKHKLNVHNQYLQTLLETGIIGFGIFVAFFSILLKIRPAMRVYTLTFLIIFGTGFFIESMLSRNLGTFPMSFWVFILLAPHHKNKPEEHKFIDEGKKITFEHKFHLN